MRVGRSEIEPAFDSGRINTAGDHAGINEIEIELTHGERADAALLARRLARSIPISYEPLAKSERGYALLEGSSGGPVFARPISLPPSATTEDAFVIVGFECLRHISANDEAGDAKVQCPLRTFDGSRQRLVLKPSRLPRRKLAAIQASVLKFPTP